MISAKVDKKNLQIFIFGASNSANNNRVQQAPMFFEKSIKGQKIFDWILNSVKGLNNSNITFVGGYYLDQVIAKYPELDYVVNPKWNQTHVVGSLRYALESWRGGEILLMYADTVFRPQCVKQFLIEASAITAGIDTGWRKRIVRKAALEDAEKVIIKNNLIVRAGRRSLPAEEANAQFSGLLYFDTHNARILHDLFYAPNEKCERPLSDNDSLTDLLGYIITNTATEINAFDVEDNWAEIDSPSDLSKFVFGTKAETLERIKPFVKHSRICDQIHFTLKEWEQQKSSIIQSIQNVFGNTHLIIRSSSLEEDSWDDSQAGAFLSVADVPANDNLSLNESIERVIAAFIENGSGKYNDLNQVLIQPYISNVDMSGVALSKHLEKGTPYYIINYDDVSKSTDSITSGNIENAKSISIFKHSNFKHSDSRIAKIVSAIEELELITGYGSLDVEFVLTADGELYVVQVRPITLHTGLSDITNFEQRVNQAKDMVLSRMKPKPYVFGETTALADMPDWNPAEMIGTSPSPLAVSLYQYLITDSAWRIARGKMGYHNPSPETLLVCVGGHPYIDVRASFNNLIPDGLNEELAHKLIDHYVNRLKANPEFHDKVEFEIAITCYTPDIDLHLQRLRDNGFEEEEIRQLKDRLRILTENAISGKLNPIAELIEQTETLEPRFKAIIEKGYSLSDIPLIIQFLLDDCIERGTIPFSILARYGFIASSMLRALVAKGVITEDEKNQFLNSVSTIAGELVDRIHNVQCGNISLEEFIREFGHLRPGSYDITSYSYGEKPNYYFSNVAVADDKHKQETKKEFDFAPEIKKDIQLEIEAMGMSVHVDAFLSFVKRATAAREYAKYQFTKNLDMALRLLVEWGNSYHISRADMAYLFIQDVLKLRQNAIAKDVMVYLKQKIQDGKNWHEETNSIETPQVIFSPSDLELIQHNPSAPNFVTNKTVISNLILLQGETDKEKLKDRVVLIEGADPGYDWIFMHPIKGLITKYGGAASHMTIRCAEFGLPAAIGCGEELFRKLTTASQLELNCANKQIKVLG